MSRSHLKIEPFPKPAHDHGACIAQALGVAEELCRRRGRRLTPLRRRVLELLWRDHRPTGAYDLLALLRQREGKSAPATVYRALEFLREQGLVHRLASINAFIGCAYPGDPHSGQFLICTSCREMAEVDDRRVNRALAATAQDHGFAISAATVEIMGLCPRCREARA